MLETLRWLVSRAGQAFFIVIGLAFLTFSFYSLLSQDIASASATFAMAFFSFIYSNISRFKRFKGLGFEAELWEDKQKEAAQLIDRLKAMVTVYTREIVMQKVMQNRYSGDGRWAESWKLYQELVAQHAELGQQIDFRDLKANLDAVFLFDIVSRITRALSEVVMKGRANAQSKISVEFGNPISDIEGHNSRITQLNEIPASAGELFQISMEGNVALHVLEWAQCAKAKLKENFEIEITFPNGSISKLRQLSELYQRGPIEVTEELIAWADEH